MALSIVPMLKHAIIQFDTGGLSGPTFMDDVSGSMVFRLNQQITEQMKQWHEQLVSASETNTELLQTILQEVQACQGKNDQALKNSDMASHRPATTKTRKAIRETLFGLGEELKEVLVNHMQPQTT